MVDAFTKDNFCGNPAGICILENEISSILMQKIAAEHNLSETAFVYKQDENYKLRWFTPKFEINLCGHATLAAAYIIFNFIEKDIKQITFETMSGLIKVRKKQELIEMRLPNWKMEKIKLSESELDLLGVKPIEVYGKRDLCIVLSS